VEHEHPVGIAKRPDVKVGDRRMDVVCALAHVAANTGMPTTGRSASTTFQIDSRNTKWARFFRSMCSARKPERGVSAIGY